MNRLADATSPYLLQHADNPVDWFPWGEEASSKARSEDKPIFLSIGYAACHWCHVMERVLRGRGDGRVPESALRGDQGRPRGTARPRRDLHGCRPGDDRQGAGRCRRSSHPRGGRSSPGRTSRRSRHTGCLRSQLLEGIEEAWRGRRDDLEQQAGRVVDAISAASLEGSTEPLTDAIAGDAIATLGRAFDPAWGGFGSAPKFPQPMTLEFALRMAVRGSADARSMVTTTLDRMASGGIYDQLGGGFARYSTDARWLVPHFEKMLSDNAQLAQRRARVAGDARGSVPARRDRDPRLPPPGDAAAGGRLLLEPGRRFRRRRRKFFAWSWEELVGIVGEGRRPLSAHTRGELGGHERPGCRGDPDDADGLAEARTALFEVRERRVRPATDDKVLTAWNAMAIQAMAEASSAFGEPSYLEEAIRTAEFLVANLRAPDGRLLRSWRDGTPGGPGYADDRAPSRRAARAVRADRGPPVVSGDDAPGGRAGAPVRRPRSRGFFQTGADVRCDPTQGAVRQRGAVGELRGGRRPASLSLLTGDSDLERRASRRSAS